VGNHPHSHLPCPSLYQVGWGAREGGERAVTYQRWVGLAFVASTWVLVLLSKLAASVAWWLLLLSLPRVREGGIGAFIGALNMGAWHPACQLAANGDTVGLGVLTWSSSILS
jgi:hypothetical protein